MIKHCCLKTFKDSNYENQKQANVLWKYEKSLSELLMTSGDHLAALNYNTCYRSPHQFSFTFSKVNLSLFILFIFTSFRATLGHETLVSIWSKHGSKQESKHKDRSNDRCDHCDCKKAVCSAIAATVFAEIGKFSTIVDTWKNSLRLLRSWSPPSCVFGSHWSQGSQQSFCCDR